MPERPTRRGRASSGSLRAGPRAEPQGRSLPGPLAVGVGMVGGTLGALLGGGAGSVTIPSLDRFTSLPRATIHGTSTIPNIAVAAVGASVYWLRGGAVDLTTGIPLVLGGVAGAVFGARLVLRVSEKVLRAVFATVLLLAGTKMLLDTTVLDLAGRSAVLPAGVRTTGVLAVALCLVVGVIVGAWAAAMGVGGGLLTVPALVLLFGLDLHVAVGTSLVVMLPNSLTGALAHSRQRTTCLPIGALLAVGAAVGAVGGALLSLALEGEVLGIVIGVYLLLMAGREALRLARGPRARPRTPETAPSPNVAGRSDQGRGG